MNTKKYEIEVDDFQHRFIIQALSEKRNELIAKGKKAEDINELLLKVIDTKMICTPKVRHFWGAYHCKVESLFI